MRVKKTNRKNKSKFMAGCSILTNGSTLDCVENPWGYQSNDCCLATDNSVKDGVDDSHADDKVKLRCLFDPVLSVFLKEITSTAVIRPFPAMLGDGRSPDLFKLFWLVREGGGFDTVTKKGLWAFVAKESGLDHRVTPSVKLIYYKYLNALETWFKERCRDGRFGSRQYGCDGDFSLLSLELETEFRRLLSDGSGKNKKKDVGLPMESCKSGNYIDMDIGKSAFDFSDTIKAFRKQEDVGKGSSVDDKNIHDDDEKLFNDEGTAHVILDSVIANKEFIFRKRKRESVAGMLNWVIHIAKHPDDPSIGIMLESCKGNNHESKEFLVQAIRAREALLLRRHTNPKAERSPLEKKIKMHPSMYEDGSAPRHHSTERLRSSERLPTLVKCHAYSFCNSCSATQSKLSPCKIELDNGPKDEKPVIDATSTTNTTHGDDSLQKQVRVDSHLQAEVPEWTGVVPESDSKWLGTCVWPLEHEKHNATIEKDPIGRGRPELCGCRLPGSVECVRFHIAEKRMTLKLQLGSAFYHWRFHHMGEEISLRWTAVEEQRFKDMVRSNHWEDAFRRFRGKTRENLVSYYFNVFLVQRRSYQNRVTPNNIDSDDDESEFGSLSGGFGHEAVKVPRFSFLECSDNKQCTDFE
ncbi:AT-rich interactive domain-containing protein 2-like isoform X2 [Carya illinoinensis]|nr:AT-rich interactive domain-containing protein 2-like isoform X2 [Carya illinoinensis]